MSDATHAFCPRCNRFEPAIWTPVKIAQPSADQMHEFHGLELKCRACQFEITKVGHVSQREFAA